MITLASKLKEKGIPFQWLVFTNDTKKAEIQELGIDEFIFMNPVLNISDYIADADYLVQLSRNGEGFGYAPCEALSLGIPVICTPCDAFKEIGIKDKENAIVLNFDMDNIDVDLIYKSRLKFKYEPPKDIYGELLTGKSEYDYEKSDYRTLICTNSYSDSTLNKLIQENEVYTLDKTQAEKVQSLGYARIL